MRKSYPYCLVDKRQTLAGDGLPFEVSDTSKWHDYSGVNLWANVEPSHKTPDAKPLPDAMCPRCGYDRCHVTHSSIASAGLATCQNPSCDYHVEI